MAAGVHLAACLHAPRFSPSLFACRPRRSPLAVWPSQFFPRWSPLAVRPSQFFPRPSMSLQEFHRPPGTGASCEGAIEGCEGKTANRGDQRGAIEGRGKNCEGRPARGDQRGENCEGRTARVRGEGREVSGNSEVRKADIDCPARYLRYV